MSEKKNQMYFAVAPDAKHDIHEINYQISNTNLHFLTDAGVFSKMRVDYGSTVLIKAMQTVPFPSQNVLDVGTGYGPIGLFAAKFWPDQTVDMIDVNTRGLELAKQNAEKNAISNVNIYSSDCYDQVVGKFGLILTNPPIRAGKKVVSKIIAEAKNHLVEDGKLLVVIQKKQGEPSARKLMESVYGNCTILTRDKGYYILQASNNNGER